MAILLREMQLERLKRGAVCISPVNIERKEENGHLSESGR